MSAPADAPSDAAQRGFADWVTGVVDELVYQMIHDPWNVLLVVGIMLIPMFLVAAWATRRLMQEIDAEEKRKSRVRLIKSTAIPKDAVPITDTQAFLHNLGGGPNPKKRGRRTPAHAPAAGTGPA